MPQFDPTWFVPQLFWLAVIFVGLLLVMYRFAVPLVGDTIHRRQAQINADLDRAHALKVEIDAAAATYERTLVEARAQAMGIVQAARDQLAEASAERHRQVAAAIQAQLDAAEGRIAEAKRAALMDVRAATQETATAAVGRLLGADLDTTAVLSAVDEAVAGGLRGQGGHA